MKKLIWLLTCILLALTSCLTGDEPSPTPAGSASLYMAMRELPGFPARIFDLKGNTIYKCEQGERIQSLVAEGSDWYALIARDEGTYRVVKNGEAVYASDGKVWCFDVHSGAFYLVLEDGSHAVWACKGWESQQDKGSWYCDQLFEVNDGRLYNTFAVHDGYIVMAVQGATPRISIDESVVLLDERLEHGFKRAYGIDFYSGYWLITYEDYQSGKNMYWWHATNYDCPQDFQPTTSRIVNGHAFILGQKTSAQGESSIFGLPAVLIDGIETVLSDELLGFAAVAVVSHGVDSYILVSHSGGSISCIYKNLHAIRLPDVTIPSPDGRGSKVNLAGLGITAIAVVEGTTKQ